MDTANTGEDRVSLKSNGKTPTNEGTTDSLGMLEKKSNENKKNGLKVTTGNESESLTPQSPSLSSPVTSPLKMIGGLFNNKGEEDSDTTPQKGKGLARSMTNPNMSNFGGSLQKTIRRSLNLDTRKDKRHKPPLVPVSEGAAEERTEDKVKEEDVVWEEMEEDNTLSEIPRTPLSGLSSPVTSPLKMIGGFFNNKGEEDSDTTPQKGKGLARSMTNPNMSNFGGSLQKTIRRSLNLGTRKDKRCKPPLVPVSEGAAEERTEDKVKEEDVVWEEMEEDYTLPEIPRTPLSVMEINKLIEMALLEEAHLNLLALRQELQQEQERSGDDSPMELAKKEKDLNLLYGELRKKFKTIMCDPNSLELLEPMVRIIQEEEKRAGQPGGLQDSWMEAWREMVDGCVQVKIKSIKLEQREKNPSWLAVHLGLLGKSIVDDLENVKKDLRWSYPPSFKVFSTYVRSYHSGVRQHLKKLEPQVTEVKDLYALLNWIINSYKSEKIMGSVSLQPEMKEENSDLQLEEDCLKKLKDKYCCRLKEVIRGYLDRVIDNENETIWDIKKTPEKDDENLFFSYLHMDVLTNVKGPIVHSAEIDDQLKQKVISSCLQELKDFPKRFEEGFRHHCSSLQQELVWSEYQITYINSFMALQQHMERYRDTCPAEEEEFKKETNGLIFRLMQGLEDQFKEDVKPYLRRMITRKWLTNDEDFKQLYRRTDLLSEHCALMRPPHSQELASRLHYHVVREYIGQLMKNNFSCKNHKHEKAASKIHKQWKDLTVQFENMNSSHEWLYAVGNDLSDIIQQKNKEDIKNHLQPLVEQYPDFCKKHLVAVLYFRGLTRGQ
ncbi:hypothetical protein PBY51_011029 [Eleginops maclovinus]|uniref:Exocyst complex component 3-like protein 4 n=2 Tax=Eleginops maclovinus TaxID=56733 RepID=A0AAN7XCU1_ELEMC|nr:hypothetical protein PBY51_011029 [Eleginops maclovinus]